MSDNDIPNREWYIKQSSEKGTSARCPFATVKKCPRYYQSLSLMGEAGSTKIPEDEDKRLLTEWQASDLWPRTSEQATGIYGEGPHMFSNFCPEVTLDRFGYAASYLSRYADELDSGAGHARTAKLPNSKGHPGWAWASCEGQHFTECNLYSVLDYRAKLPLVPTPSSSEPWWRKYGWPLALGLIALAGAILKAFF